MFKYKISEGFEIEVTGIAEDLLIQGKFKDVVQIIKQIIKEGTELNTE